MKLIHNWGVVRAAAVIAVGCALPFPGNVIQVFIGVLYLVMHLKRAPL